MTRQAISCFLVLLVGLAGGTGIGYFMLKPRLSEAQTTLAQVQTELSALQTEQSQSSEKFKAAATEISKLKTDLVNARNDVMRKNTELLRAQTDAAKMRTLLEQTLGQGADAAIGAAGTPTPQPTVRTGPVTGTAPTTAQAVPTPAATAGTREYTVQDGDSLWKIAAGELGNGMRYKDIEALNPELAGNKNLSIGMKIKLPTK
jgi:nucleoid-associated protein YgaU